MGIVPFHFLFHFEILVGQRLAHLLRLQSQHTLEGVFLGAKDLDLALVVVELLGKLTNHVLVEKTKQL